ncbi:hypothetical protein TSUD_60410 [Trifolium subterraneum]|uniref:Reticulon domain-containing protein n=1 Tax=Trifolium subterraneum TaxID=3900 RepID=A0A2Z6N439_TRISU|nr:hypothetical protein TSUD_60410 [Trifolium subterraneum]
MDSSTSTPHHHHRSSERRTTTTSPSPLSLLRSPTNCLPLRDLLLMSPPSSRKSKPRFDEELQESPGVRRRCKSRGAALSSPRNSSRRSRRRLEVEVKEEKENVLVDDVGKLRKRKHKKDRLSLVPFQSPKAEEENEGDLDRIGIIFSTISQLALLFLAVSFFSNSVCQQRGQVKQRGYVKLKEDDILRLAKVILPMLNFSISKAKELFSGEPSMTLKVAPLLLLGAEYGHFITIWRLSAIGFFVSFSVPKLYFCYSAQINQRAECLKLRLLDTWSACSYKKIVVVSALITFWNLSSIKTQICTAFLLLVIFRYFRQNVTQQVEEGEAQAEDKEQQQALLAAEPEEEEPQQALLVVAEQRCQQ